jgi:hypothetical protein
MGDAEHQIKKTARIIIRIRREEVEEEAEAEGGGKG